MFENQSKCLLYIFADKAIKNNGVTNAIHTQDENSLQIFNTNGIANVNFSVINSKTKRVPDYNQYTLFTCVDTTGNKYRTFSTPFHRRNGFRIMIFMPMGYITPQNVLCVVVWYCWYNKTCLHINWHGTLVNKCNTVNNVKCCNLLQGRVFDFLFFDCLSPFWFLLIELHWTFSISHKMLTNYVYYYCILIR